MTGQHRNDDRSEEPERVVVRDRRRIDPLTGRVRQPEGAQPSGSGSGGETEVGETTVDAQDVVPDPAEQKLVELSAQLDERTADLQRVSAEYANYRRRVDRDRETVALNTRAQVAGQLLTVLDDLDRAAAHGDLTGAFKAVADKLVAALRGVGLEAFGAIGEPFDPAVHEAVQHDTSTEVEAPTVSLVMRHGYKIGERVLRPAMVSVTDRDPSAPPVGTIPVDTAPPGGTGPPADTAANQPGAWLGDDEY